MANYSTELTYLAIYLGLLIFYLIIFKICEAVKSEKKEKPKAENNFTILEEPEKKAKPEKEKSSEQKIIYINEPDPQKQNESNFMYDKLVKEKEEQKQEIDRLAQIELQNNESLREPKSTIEYFRNGTYNDSNNYYNNTVNTSDSVQSIINELDAADSKFGQGKISQEFKNLSPEMKAFIVTRLFERS